MPALLVRRFGALAVAALLVVGLLPAAASPVRAASPTELFFSEYIEGSSNNKALEIYNGTGAAVNLATGGYNVQMFFNGSATAGLTINLTGTVANGDVFVLAQSSANATILAQADQTNGSGWFNGDDAAVLRKGTTVIDVIGQIGVDPGTEWGTGLTSTADNTLRRKAAIGAGDTNGTDAFDPSIEWDGFATDTFGGLGSHAYVPPDPVINEFSASTTGTDVEYVEIYGAASTSYAAYTILEIEGDTGAPSARSTRSSPSARLARTACTSSTSRRTPWRTAPSPSSWSRASAARSMPTSTRTTTGRSTRRRGRRSSTPSP